MTGVADDSAGRLLGRPWLIVGFALAIGATLALVLSDDMRWLRLGIVAALWAALIGAFLAAKYRKHAAHSEDAVAEAQAVYELELEREIAARREYELEIETETRQRVESNSRDELDALRTEVLALRESLQSLFGGEVLFERVALTAQSTRMRSLAEDKRTVSAPERTVKPAQLTAAKKPEVQPERPTELIGQVLEQGTPVVQPDPAKLRAMQQARPVRPPEPEKPAPGTNRDQEVAAAAARAAKAAQEARARADRRQQPGPSTGQQQATRTELHPAAPERTGEQTSVTPPVRPVRPSRNAVQAPPAEPRTPTYERMRPVARQSEPEVGIEPEWNPSWEDGTAERKLGDQRKFNDLSAAFPVRTPPPVANGGGRGMGAGNGAANGRAAANGEDPTRHGRTAAAAGEPRQAPAARTFGSTGFQNTGSFGSAGRSNGAGPAPSAPLAATGPMEAAAEPVTEVPAGRHGRPEGARAESSRRAMEPVERTSVSEPVEPPRNNPTLPDSVRQQMQQPGRSGGRRRRPDDEDGTPSSFLPQPDTTSGNGYSSSYSRGSASSAHSSAHSSEDRQETGGGRRRRPDGEPPSWESGGSHSNGSRHSGGGSHSSESSHSSHSGHAAKEEEESAGSHAEGRSVSELLAAHGSGGSTPRRRRRAED